MRSTGGIPGVLIKRGATKGGCTCRRTPDSKAVLQGSNTTEFHLSMSMSPALSFICVFELDNAGLGSFQNEGVGSCRAAVTLAGLRCQHLLCECSDEASGATQ